MMNNFFTKYFININETSSGYINVGFDDKRRITKVYLSTRKELTHNDIRYQTKFLASTWHKDILPELFDNKIWVHQNEFNEFMSSLHCLVFEEVIE